MVTNQRTLVLAGVGETLNGLRHVGIFLFIMGALIFFFVTVFYKLIILLVGLVIVFAGGRKHSVALLSNPHLSPRIAQLLFRKKL